MCFLNLSGVCHTPKEPVLIRTGPFWQACRNPAGIRSCEKPAVANLLQPDVEVLGALTSPSISKHIIIPVRACVWKFKCVTGEHGMFEDEPRDGGRTGN